MAAKAKKIAKKSKDKQASAAADSSHSTMPSPTASTSSLHQESVVPECKDMEEGSHSNPAFSQFEGMDKKQIRLIKNRLAADASRKRKREQFEELGRRVEILEKENADWKLLAEQLSRDNASLMVKAADMERECLELKNTLHSMGLPLPQSSSSTAQMAGIAAQPFASSFAGSSNFLGLQLHSSQMALDGTGTGSLSSLFPLSPSFSGPCSPINSLATGPSPVSTSTPSLTLGSLPSSSDASAGDDENDLGTRMLNDFVDFAGMDDSNDVLFKNPSDARPHGGLVTSIFTMLFFSFAAFLFPSSLHQLGSLSQPTILPSVPPSSELAVPLRSHSALSSAASQIIDNKWHLASVSSPTALSLERMQFMNTLETLAKTNPPNAVMGIEGLFSYLKGVDGGMDVDLAVIPPYTASCLNQATLMIQPDIRLVPYVPLDGSQPDGETGDGQLRVSLFANVPSSQPASGLGVKGDGGILRLDMQVFSATWLQP
ncbi:hypothetical protein HDU91_000846 [Kappamyces sp. JEL0680]|nr:hypothetical protein HDU91_000846 [Kappamyces sp. JEL0680]